MANGYDDYTIDESSDLLSNVSNFQQQTGYRPPQQQQNRPPEPQQQYNNNQQSYNNNNPTGNPNAGWKSNNYSRDNYQNNMNNGGNNYQQKPNYSKPYNNAGNNNFRQQDMSQGKLYKSYVGTGNKEAPQHVLDGMRHIAEILDRAEFVARTGGMGGPDDVFECVKNFELYLPFKNFNGKDSKNTFNSKQANDIASIYHPTYNALKDSIKAILAKNVRLVCGQNLKSNCMFVIVWSDDGVEHKKDVTSRTGNVGHLISIASDLYIPVFNFARPDAEQRLMQRFEL